MKKGFFKKVVKSVVVAGAGVVASAGSAMAAPWIDVSGLTVDTAPVATLGLTVLAGLASIWGLRKLVKFINRS